MYITFFNMETGKVSVWRHHFFIRYEIIQILIYLNEISLFVKICEKVVAPYGKLSFFFFKIWLNSEKIDIFIMNIISKLYHYFRPLPMRNCLVCPFTSKTEAQEMLPITNPWYLIRHTSVLNIFSPNQISEVFSLPLQMPWEMQG